MKAKDETGKRYGRLLVLRREGRIDRCAVWLCVCDCGEQRRVSGKSLRCGDTSSCGCLQRERSAQRAKPKDKKPKDSADVITVVKKREPWIGGFDSSGYLCGEPPSWLRIGAA